MMNNPNSINSHSIQESLPGKTERRRARNASIFEASLVSAAIVQSFRMLNPVVMAKNPVMFITEIGAVLTTAITVYDASLNKPGLIYNLSVLLVLWVLGLVSSYTMGGFIHILLVVAVVVVLVRIIQGRRPV